MVDVYGFFKIQMKPRRVVKNRKMKLHGSGFFLISKSTFESGSYSVSGTLEDFFEERQLYWKAKRLRWVKRFQVGFLPFKICRGRRLGRIKSCRLILVNWVNWNASNRSKWTSVTFRSLWCLVYQIEFSFVKRQFHVRPTASSTQWRSSKTSRVTDQASQKGPNMTQSISSISYEIWMQARNTGGVSCSAGLKVTEFAEKWFVEGNSAGIHVMNQFYLKDIRDTRGIAA